MSDSQVVSDAYAAAISAGRYDVLVGDYVYPLPLYLPARPPMSVSAQGVWGFFQSFHAALLSQGMTTLTAHLVAQGLPKRGRVQYWTDWYGQGPGVARRLVAQTVCYRRAGPNDLRTELLEFTRLDLPILAAA